MAELTVPGGSPDKPDTTELRTAETESVRVIDADALHVATEISPLRFAYGMASFVVDDAGKVRYVPEGSTPLRPLAVHEVGDAAAALHQYVEAN